MTSLNFTGRAGRWSAQHRKIAIFGWLAFVALILVVGMAGGMKMLSGSDSLAGESARAQHIINRAGMPETTRESVIVESRMHRVTDPRFRAAVASVLAGVRKQPYVSGVTSPYNQSANGLISRNGHAALVQFDIAGDMMDSMMRVSGPLKAVASARSLHPGFRIAEFGGASFSKATADQAGRDFHRAEILSIPATVFILMLAFGAFLAAILPVILALTAFAGALGLVLLTSHIFPINNSAFSVMLLIGLAVGVDYSIFYIRREREERAAGRTAEAALEAAAATSGRSVLISGLTVIVAVAGMFFAGTGDFRGIAMGTILVVATSVLGSLTVLPALLSKLGDRIEKGRLPLLHRFASKTGKSPFWEAAVTRVLRHPVVAAVGAVVVLVLLAAPALRMHTTQPGLDDYPQSMQILHSYSAIKYAFPGGPSPAKVAVDVNDVSSPAFMAAVANFRRDALATKQAFDPIVTTRLSKHVAVISVPLAGNGQDAVSEAALKTLRTSVVPKLADAAGVRSVAVGGDTAAAVDYNSTLQSHIAIVFAFVLGLAFLLLLVTFRSIVIAAKAIFLNLLSVGAAYGFIVAVFQWGWGEHILGFHSTHSITAWIPLFLFVVLFGLSMDYHVFILSRIREAVDGGMTTEDAVAHGIKGTAGIVTSAAIVMVVVFSIFASLSQVSMKEIGTGLALAVLLDATIVRAVLLPASMKLLGKWNWWLPTSLEWLPRVELEAPHHASAEPASA